MLFNSTRMFVVDILKSKSLIVMDEEKSNIVRRFPQIGSRLRREPRERPSVKMPLNAEALHNINIISFLLCARKQKL